MTRRRRLRLPRRRLSGAVERTCGVARVGASSRVSLPAMSRCFVVSCERTIRPAPGRSSRRPRRQLRHWEMAECGTLLRVLYLLHSVVISPPSPFAQAFEIDLLKSHAFSKRGASFGHKEDGMRCIGQERSSRATVPRVIVFSSRGRLALQ